MDIIKLETRMLFHGNYLIQKIHLLLDNSVYDYMKLAVVILVES